MSDKLPPGMRPGWTDDDRRKAAEAKAALKAKDEAVASEMDEAAFENPSVIIRLLFSEAAKAARRGYSRLNKTGVKDKDLVEISREARQLADKLWDIIQHEGKLASADTILAQLDDRAAEVAARLGASWTPPLTPPARSGDVLDDAGDLRGRADPAGPVADLPPA